MPTTPFDALAWLGATAATLWQYRKWPSDADRMSGLTTPGYFASLGLGALAGAWLIGSGNSLRAPIVAPSHSIAGALAGGIVAVEIWKRVHGIRASTGGAFVLPLCVGIIIGRLGCLFAGLPDYTYGVSTRLPWAVDLGDGVGRHPVQLYESMSMAIFLAAYLHARDHGVGWARDHAFQAMIIFYAAQRFVWEFLKPYPAVLGPLNLFHLLMMGLVAYGLIFWRRSTSASQRIA